tara:strand:- start:427 stop:891 length:465 start_codon:yes stop_codon:yes gene_type:complete
MVWTNLGKQRLMEEFFEASSVETTFRLQLCSATLQSGIWDSDLSSTNQVNLVSALTVGTSGLVVTRNGLDFAVSSSSDLGDTSAAQAVLATTGDAFQFSGAIDGASYVLLTQGAISNVLDPELTELYAWWAIGAVQNIAEGNTLTINTLSLQGQ